jgi:uncharacterized protein (DUF1015 family)
MSIFKRADILLPADVPMEQWAVIACDQFTSDELYWKRVRDHAADAPSTLHMILPEAELGAAGEADRIKAINEAMVAYLHEGIFEMYPQAYIYVERTLQNGTIRPGLVGMVDLDAYDYKPGSVSPIRATEKTVLERIPPRKRVRKDAALEFPHVLMLCDDDEKRLIEPIAAQKDGLPLLYDFDLMEQGGHITGWLVQNAAADAFDQRFAAFCADVPGKYGDLNGVPVVLAVGDGNHSLATAKSCYETLKEENPGKDLSGWAARYALVELENIHDDAQVFEPIHRILLRVDGEKLLSDLRKLEGAEGFEIHFIHNGKEDSMILDRAHGEMAVAILQPFLDAWLAEHGGQIDYIHGEEELRALAQQAGSVGFLLPPMEKHELFRGVIAGGVLPRKTFSMGHAREKRYYLEGRMIK